ncbi:MAG TPA: DUF2179 domain-containing protein [Gemmatales bacterium]|nr:DUF2179 domain-containing protein [Gemmatales bacterium]
MLPRFDFVVGEYRSMSWWLPVLILIAETCVVTFGTLRSIFVARGLKKFAVMLGLIESTFWLFAIGQVVSNLSALPCSVAYAVGFTLGNFLGMTIEEKLAIGTQVVRIITNKPTDCLIAQLNAADFGVTYVEGDGATGPVNVIFTIVKRKQMKEVLKMLRDFDPHLFYTVEDVRSYKKGVFRERRDEPSQRKVPFRVKLERETVQL